MKLFSNKLTKIKILFLIVFSILEVASFFIIYFSYKPLYTQVFNQSKEISIEKTRAITHTLSQIFELSFHRYVQDLKLIGKHMSFFSNNQINAESQYYKNIINNKDKHIYFATIENLKNDFEKYYDDKQKKFLYMENYIKEYIENTTNSINIVNDLMNKEKHPELNAISYYKLNGDINDIENNLQKKAAAKYLISILKTNYINRLLVKESNLEIVRYYLLTEDELFIYPPEAYNNTLIYYTKEQINCLDNFPQCFYDYFIDFIFYLIIFEKFYGYIVPIIPISNPEYEIIMNSICINIPFENELDIYDFTQNAIICMEINMTIILEKHMFKSKDSFNFFLVSFVPEEIITLFTDKEIMYAQVKSIFNDTKFGEYSLDGSENFVSYKYYNLFQFLYLEILNESSLLKENGITIDYLIDEYENIKSKIFEKVFEFIEDEESQHFVIDIQKTTCKSDLYYNRKKCLKDNFLVIVYKINSNFHIINELYIEHPDKTTMETIFFSMSIINNNYDYLKWKINQILIYKIIRLFFFLFILSICLASLYFIFITIFFDIKYNLINKLLSIIKSGSLFESKNMNEIIKVKGDIIIEPNNKEMMQIKNLFDYLVKNMILKIKFNQREIYLDNLNEYKYLIENINNDEIRIMLSFILSYEHFKKGYFKLSENEFKNLINEIYLYQNNLSNVIENNESKLKDTISRCSKISYLNEYSLTNELNETTLPIIKIKLLIQKIYYLNGICIFNQEKIRFKTDKKYKKESSNKRYEEAIQNFIGCKNISISLGTDTIRQIFSLIMISKCFNELKNYKESMININEALLLFSDLQKSFKDKPYFNPKVMLFVENYIFQNIMLSIAQTTFGFNKYPQSCWILMKMIETSPFIFNNIHYKSCALLYNCLNQIETIFNLPLRQTDKYKKKINKIIRRINLKLYNKEENNNNFSINNAKINDKISLHSGTNTQTNIFNISSEFLSNHYNSKKLNKNKDMITNKLSMSISTLTNLIKNQYKNITLCISEKLLQDINGNDLKYFIIKCYKKCFLDKIENNKYNFIQFSCNGKKTISIISKTLEIFLQKLEMNKMAFKIIDTFINNTMPIQFMEFSNLLMNIIKSNKQENIEEKYDNIIIIFINSTDIRFNNQKECVDTINELNNNNYSLIIFTYDYEIEEEKIEGIISFIYGLNDGHFFQVKNFQQIKQVFKNFSEKNSQEKFINYDYEVTEYMI